MMLKAFMDESGVHDGSPVVTVGAYLGTARAWRGFIADWNREKRPVRVFHSTDCQNLRGEFAGWSGEERDTFVVRMLAVIRETTIAGIAVGINMNDFREAVLEHPDLPRIIGEPYGACFHWTLGSLLEQLDGMGVHDRLAIYHEANDYQGDARTTFDFFQEGERGPPPAVADLRVQSRVRPTSGRRYPRLRVQQAPARSEPANAPGAGCNQPRRQPADPAVLQRREHPVRDGAPARTRSRAGRPLGRSRPVKLEAQY